MSKAIEVTTFRLAKGVSMKRFVKANEDIDPWLRKQPGFISRHMFEREDGHVVDSLFWTSSKARRQAASGIVKEMAHSPVHAAIDHSTVDWSVKQVAHDVLK
jgi:hypothetical protein